MKWQETMIHVFISFPSYNWVVSWQNQHSTIATSMDPDQPAHPRSLIMIHAVCLQTQKQVEIQIANSVDPDQTARMRRLVWIYADRKPITLVLSWHGSYNCYLKFWDAPHLIYFLTFIYIYILYLYSLFLILHPLNRFFGATGHKW
jgi:hypothetical protein